MSLVENRVIKVLIVDDSAVVRQVFQRVLERAPGIEVVGVAPDPFVARDMLLNLKPDVVTLDLEMPRMDGLTFLQKIMTYSPMPVIVVSSLTPKGSASALDALKLGAVDVLHKPTAAFAAQDLMKQLVVSVRAAAMARVRATPKQSDSKMISGSSLKTTTNKVLAIGASTGGTVAVERILKVMPANMPGTIIVQHMPPGVTANFAQRLNDICYMEVREAKHGDSIVPGVALLAPGSRHMAVKRTGARYHIELIDGPPINYHRPSIDVTFKSVAQYVGTNAVGVILTGMGRDGAEGLLKMRNAGAETIAQDEASSVIFGMPRVAAELGAAGSVVGLSEMAEAIVEKLTQISKRTTGAVLAKESASAA